METVRRQDANLEGTIRVQGSTSVDPYMQKIEEAHKAIHTGVKFDHTANGSGARASRRRLTATPTSVCLVKSSEEELDQGLTAKAIAIDGICVIVAPEKRRVDALPWTRSKASSRARFATGKTWRSN